MNDLDEQILELAENVSFYNEIKLSDIPDIELYMDQVTSFIDSKLSNFKRNKEDLVLTKTMINNYTKVGILAPPVKKKYNVENMILLIWIYHMKQTLSINDIGYLLKPFVNLDDKENTKLKLADLYNKFLKIQNKVSNNFYEDVKEKIDIIETSEEYKNINDDEKKFLAAMMLILSAETQKEWLKK